MSFVLITSSNLDDKRMESLTDKDRVFVLYQSEDKLNVETMKEFAEKNIQVSFISNKEDKIGYAAIFKLGEIVEKENITSLLLYDKVDDELIDALRFCGLEINFEKEVVPLIVQTEEPPVENKVRRGRKPGSKNKNKIAV